MICRRENGMSEFSESLEKSVEFLKERYPSDHPLLTSLESTLDNLKVKKSKIFSETSTMGQQRDN